MSINLFNDTGPIVQETVSNKPTIITEFDVPSDKIVYFGSQHKFENGIIDSINGIIFVTPYKSIASIFTCDRDKYKTGGKESRITNINYKEWNVLSDEPLKVVHVIIEGDPERDRTEFESIGYIYKINIEGYEDKLQIYDWMSKDKEMFLQVDKIPYLEVEECVTKRIVSGDEKEDEYIMYNEMSNIFNMDFNKIITESKAEVKENKKIKKISNDFIKDNYNSEDRKKLSNKQKNRIKKFLKDNDYDPKTKTYKADFVDKDGKNVRIPLDIIDMNTNTEHGKGYIHGPGSSYSRDLAKQSLKNQGLLLQDLSADQRELMKKGDHKIYLNNKTITRKPVISNGVLKHEEGHLAKYERNSKTDSELAKTMKSDAIKSAKMIKKALKESEDLNKKYNNHMNKYELSADAYSIRNNKYIKNKNDVEKYINALNFMDTINHKFSKTTADMVQRDTLEFSRVIACEWEMLDSIIDYIQDVKTAAKQNLKLSDHTNKQYDDALNRKIDTCDNAIKLLRKIERDDKLSDTEKLELFKNESLHIKNDVVSKLKADIDTFKEYLQHLMDLTEVENKYRREFARKIASDKFKEYSVSKVPEDFYNFICEYFSSLSDVAEEYCDNINYDGTDDYEMEYNTAYDDVIDEYEYYQEEEHLLSKELPKSIEDDTIDDDVDDNIDENIDDIDTEKDTSNDINTVDDAVNINFDIDISDMGNDTSDVQNEYNKSEVDELNHLIAAESDAINDYFEAGKNAKTPVLTKLYADIGAEERFHLEQLMYAKSTITGEKYEPRDEKVKAEYEELLNMGMDEETAMTTAVDKLSINNNDIDDGDDSDLEEIQADIETMESALLQTDLLFAICESSSTPIECNNALNVFIESYLVYQEALENVSAKENKNIVKVKNPIKLLGDGIRRIISLLVQLAHKVRDYISKSKLKRARKMAWLKEHGIKGLFQRGVSLYFYDDRVGMVMTDDALKFSQLLYDVTKQIAKRTGIQLKNAAQKQSIKNPIPCASPEDGVNKINNFIYNKTKVVITDKNESVIMQQFFGYSDNKLGVGVTREGDDPNKSYHESNNVYNRLELMAKVTAEYAEISRSVLTMLEGFEGNINSIYYKNRAVYNKSVEQMRDVCNGYKKLVSAITHDLSTIMKLDNGILEQSRQQDRMNQPEQFENAGNSEPIPNEDKYVTKKKPGFFDKFKK